MKTKESVDTASEPVDIYDDGIIDTGVLHDIAGGGGSADPEDLVDDDEDDEEEEE